MHIKKRSVLLFPLVMVKITLIFCRYLLDLISHDDLVVESEEQVFDTVINWIEEDIDERLSSHGAPLLAKVRLAQLPIEVLMKRVINHPIVEVRSSCFLFKILCTYSLLKFYWFYNMFYDWYFQSTQ